MGIGQGSVVGVTTVRLTAGIGGERADMLTLAIQHLVDRFGGGERAREVVVPDRKSVV